MRYIESNPVRARLVAAPGEFRWSSFRANALGHDDALVTPHSCYYALGRSAESRRAAYRALFERDGYRTDRSTAFVGSCGASGR